MLWIKAVKKQRGIELIDAVINRFQVMIDDLHGGVMDCESEQDNITTTIVQLNNRNDVLHNSVSRAKTIIDNLRKLVSD